MGRSPCCEKEHTNKGAWTKEEDEHLISYIRAHGEGCWRYLPKAAGLLRCGKSCRLRWINYLRPDLKRGNFTDQDDDLIINLHSLVGNKWSLIAARLPGRTDNEIKNYWNTHIKRKLLRRGIDPQTHRTITGTTTAVAAASSRSSQISELSGGHSSPRSAPIPNFSSAVTASAGEDSSSSGTTTEELRAQLNLDLTIGLPHHMSPSVESEQQQQQQEKCRSVEQPLPCLRCGCRAGFEGGVVCSNGSKCGTMTMMNMNTMIAATDLHRYYYRQ